MKAHLEPIARAEGHSFHSRLIREPRFNHPLHYHPEIEITWIIQSRGTRLVGDHVGSFRENDLCLLGRNLPHIYSNTTVIEGDAEAEVLQFHRDMARGFIDAMPELHSFALLLDQASNGIAFTETTARQAGPILRKIRQAAPRARLRLFGELVECLVAARDIQILASPGYTGSMTRQESKRMQVACQYVLEHFAEDICHRTLAEKVNLTPSSFSRLFKQITRKTFTAFVNEVRLGHACRLLMETNRSITDVAFASGFSNLSNFNRRFRNLYGTTPRQYRQQCR